MVRLLIVFCHSCVIWPPAALQRKPHAAVVMRLQCTSPSFTPIFLLCVRTEYHRTSVRILIKTQLQPPLKERGWCGTDVLYPFKVDFKSICLLPCLRRRNSHSQFYFKSTSTGADGRLPVFPSCCNFGAIDVFLRNGTEYQVYSLPISWERSCSKSSPCSHRFAVQMTSCVDDTWEGGTRVGEGQGKCFSLW